MIQAVIFNLDGVLTDTDACHERAWRQMAREQGLPFTPEIYRKMRGRRRMDSLNALLSHAERTYSPGETWALAARKNDLFNDLVLHLGREGILPGAEETLRTLRDMGIRTAVASSSENAAGILRQMKMDALLDAVVDGEDTAEGKPAPELLLLAARRLKTPTGNCLVIDNSLAGAEAARAAGMRCLLIGNETGAAAESLNALALPERIRRDNGEMNGKE
ncbi:MAG: beta-phosphoglucomutase family hydrolase [Clostridiales bacterium]|nr:beta-phosphoglucomutase family hydrolase [Clostridiales bacterium]